MKPRIGISASISPAHERRSFAKGAMLQYLPDAYCHFVLAGGGVPVMIPILDQPAIAVEVIRALDGLIISGGGDIDPSLYSESNSHSLGCDLVRDRFEIALVQAARHEARALLAICRGMQVLNVAFGGSLYQDVPTMIEGAQQHHNWEAGKDAYHTILFTRPWPLAELFQSEEVQVNSSHHQSLKEVGKGLEVLAAAKDGVIEAVTCPADRFTFGVQWHPERMLSDPKQVELARWFVSHAV